MNRILITGGTGLVGQALSNQLILKGYDVVYLTRNKNTSKNKNFFYWNIPENIIDISALKGVKHIIHLAGENIAGKRWNKQQKNKILDSRINSSKLILQVLKETDNNIESIISASGVGYYGTAPSEQSFSEDDQPGRDFLSTVCVKWENEINKAKELSVRTVNIRTGLVLSNKGGAFPKMTTPIKLGAGAILGSGKQYMPWIHIDDLCAVYIEAIENKLLSGPINAAAPQDISNRDFTIAVAEHLNKTLWLPKVPSFFLTMIFGDMASLFLKGNKVQPNKVLSIKFKFKFPTLNQALFDLLG